MKLVWSPESVTQVNAILLDISELNPAAANRWFAKLLSTVENITEFPKAGKPYAEAHEPALRELIVGSYRVIYLVGKNVVEIYAVRHGARRAPGRGLAGEIEDE